MVTNIFTGLKAYIGSFQLLQQLKLWKYFIIPIIISFLIAIILLFTAYYFSESIGNKIASFWSFQWGAETVSTLSHVIGGLLVLAIGLVMYKHVVMALAGPFMSPVSEKIEAHIKGEFHKEEGIKAFANSLSRSIKINIRNLIRELLLVIPLFILSLIPVIGILFTILMFLVQAYYAGFGNMDYTLERHLKYSESIRFVKQNRGVAIVNVIGFILLILVAVVGFIIVLPCSVVAATIKTLEALDKRNELLEIKGQYK